jgi:endonuclease YncB( thermonuclease family)
MRRLTLAVLSLMGAPASAADDSQHSFEAKVVKIADGDTITVLLDRTQHKIRLEGIDSPETRKPFSTRAKRALAMKITS